MYSSLLVGAGFSRNWGGYLAAEVVEYLLGCSDIGADPRLRDLLWRSRGEGFEVALGELQAAFRNEPDKFAEPLGTFQKAIVSMFSGMNAVFENQRFDFPPTNIATSVTYFLSKFDAIFSLNQDLLLESHYMECNFSVGGAYREWAGQEWPGLRLAEGQQDQGYRRWFRNIWQPGSESSYKVREGTQPIYKLHGSSNWIERDGSGLLVVGGGKEDAIAQHPILTWYASELSRALRRADARLFVIGYGFRDHHINRAIASAVYENGLKLFVICPEGSDIAAVLRSPVHPGAALTAYGYDLEDVFARGLIDASRRSLRETFGRDPIEHAKVMRFFTDQ